MTPSAISSKEVVPASIHPDAQERSSTVSEFHPNFLVVGAAKSGTTSLHEYLGQHPQIFMSANKEPHYFVHGYGVEKWEDYLGLFAPASGKKAIGESSTLYLYCRESPPWIKSALGNIKIIVLLRNPAKRAFSLYGWMVREGYEDARTFAEALRRESVRHADPGFPKQALQFFPDYLYFSSGLYSEQIRRYLTTFGADRVRVHLFEDFVRDPVAVCRDLFQFLEVDVDFSPTFSVNNEGRIPGSVPLQFWLRTKLPYLRFLPGRFRENLPRRLMDWNVKLGHEPKAEKAVLEQLIERYRDDILKLEQLLQRDLSHWLDPAR